METVANTQKKIYSGDRGKVPETESAMRVRELTVSYDDKTALSKISVQFPKQRITSIIGPSGCGKTTLLLSLNDLIRETPGVKVTGEIFLGDKKTDAIPQEELRRRVGLVFQTPMPFPFSVYKNLTYLHLICYLCNLKLSVNPEPLSRAGRGWIYKRTVS